MKISQKAQSCGLSPMRKFHPYAVEAANKGKTIYHLNIGQPDIETPPNYYYAIHNFDEPVLAYAASPGMPVLIKAVQNYYDRLGIYFEEKLLTLLGKTEYIFSVDFIIYCKTIN